MDSIIIKGKAIRFLLISIKIIKYRQLLIIFIYNIKLLTIKYIY